MNSAKILIVEDELIVAEYLSGILRRLGYQVLDYVSSGEKVFAQLAKEVPNLILMDLKLKGDLDGVDIAHQVKKMADVPVIFLTAYADPGTLERVKQVAPYGYLIKPILEDDLYRMIEVALHKHKIDRELRESEERFRIVTDFTYDWEYWISPEKTLLYNSLSCQRITGYPSQSFVDDPDLLLRIIHPEDREQFDRHFFDEFTEADVFHLDFRIIRADGSECWLAHICQPVYGADGKFLGRRASNRDITQRVKTRQKLELFQAIIESSTDPVSVVDHTGSLVYVNPAHTGLFGCSLEELKKRNIEEFFTPESLQMMKEQITASISKGENWEGFLEVLGADGRKIPVLGRTGVTYDNRKQKEYVYAFLHDITEEIQAQETLITAQKIASLGTFAAGMAHELNSPLQVITGVSERLLESIKKGENVTSDRLTNGLEAINRNAWRSASLVRMLLTYTQIAESLFAPHDLNKIVEDVMSELSNHPDNWKGIEIRKALAQGMPPITCDGSQFQQILIQLLNNARDAMPKGGTIDIRTGYDPDKRIFRLEVQDQGIGIPEEIRDRIYDPFFTTKPIGTGSGLGLPIVVGMVHLHDGKIDFASEVGKGTTFWLQFPEVPGEQVMEDTLVEPFGRFPA